MRSISSFVHSEIDDVVGRCQSSHVQFNSSKDQTLLRSFGLCQAKGRRPRLMSELFPRGSPTIKSLQAQIRKISDWAAVESHEVNRSLEGHQRDQREEPARGPQQKHRGSEDDCSVRDRASKLFELEDIIPNKEQELVKAETEHKEISGDADRANSKLNNLRFVDLYFLS